MVSTTQWECHTGVGPILKLARLKESKLFLSTKPCNMYSCLKVGQSWVCYSRTAVLRVYRLQSFADHCIIWNKECSQIISDCLDLLWQGLPGSSQISQIPYFSLAKDNDSTIRVFHWSHIISQYHWHGWA